MPRHLGQNTRQWWKRGAERQLHVNKWHIFCAYRPANQLPEAESTLRFGEAESGDRGEFREGLHEILGGVITTLGFSGFRWGKLIIGRSSRE